MQFMYALRGVSIIQKNFVKIYYFNRIISSGETFKYFLVLLKRSLMDALQFNKMCLCSLFKMLEEDICF